MINLTNFRSFVHREFVHPDSEHMSINMFLTDTNLKQLVFCVVLDEVGVDPALAVGQAVLGDVGRHLQGLDSFLDAANFTHQEVILGWIKSACFSHLRRNELN